MSLDAVYADDIEANLLRWAANPPPPQDESFSMKSFIGAGLKGIPAAVLEMSGGAVDATSGYGNVMAATGGTGRGMFSLPTDDERKQEAQARERMLAGDNQNVATGNVLRKKAEEFAPDPITANRADQVIFGLTRFAGKAVGYVGTMGPAGAIPLGLEEGNTETQKLRQKGIDDETAVKAGAVQGVGSAIGAVLPIGGKTVLQTLGLVAAGGPGMFMAQEATSREILQRAGYKDEASLHNPFDPLGLGLSVIVPGAFGALHMRNLPAAPKLVDVVKHIESGGNPNAVGPNIPGQGTAKGEMQVMDATNADPGFGVTPAKDNSPEERARVGREYLGAMVTRYGEQDKALAAYNAGPGTVDKAMAAHGENWLAHMPEETQKYVAKARKLTGDYVASEGAKSPEVVDAARVSVLNDTMQRNLPDVPDAYARVMRAADIVGESGGRAAEAEIPPVRAPSPFEVAQVETSTGKQVDGLRATFDNGQGGKGVMELAIDGDRLHPTWLDNGLTGLSDNPRSGGAVTQLYEQAIAEAQNRGLRFTSDDSVTEAAGRVYAALERRGYAVERNPQARLAISPEVVTPRLMTDDGSPVFTVTPPKEAPAAPAPRQRESANALPSADSVSMAGDQPAKRGAEVGAAAGPEGAAPKATEAAQTLDQAVAKKIAAEQPDLLVTLPGTEERITVAEALKRIAEEQKQDGHWADLVKVAAECALTAG